MIVDVRSRVVGLDPLTQAVGGRAEAPGGTAEAIAQLEPRVGVGRWLRFQ